MIEIEQIPKGLIQMPPSKSIGHRLLFAAFLASGTSTIAGVGKSSDILATMEVLSLLGCKMEYKDGSVSIESKLEKILNPEDMVETVEKTESLTTVAVTNQIEGIKKLETLEIEIEESGTTLRFLLPLLLALGQTATVHVSERLFNRGNETLINILNANGGQITMGDNVFRVKGQLVPGEFWIPGNLSSQYISGLFFALSILDSPSLISIDPPLESAPYVDMTMNIINHLVKQPQIVKQSIRLLHGRRIQGFEVSPGKFLPMNQSVEGDYSTASFFLVSAILGANIEIIGLVPNSIQGDEYICTFLKQMGGEFSIGPNGGLMVTREKDLFKQTRDTIFYAQEYPDLVPPIVAFLVHQQGIHEIKGAERLRLKESNRLAALVSEFSKLGANIKETAEGLWLEGGLPLHGGVVSSHNDHRIAMALATSSVSMTEKISLIGAAAVNKSHPDFWKDFLQVDK